MYDIDFLGDDPRPDGLYLRKSRAEELAGLEETLEKHRKALLDFAQKRHMVIDTCDIYEEVVSGESIDARPQMQLLLKAVEQGRYRSILCMDIDRLGRGGMKDQGTILDTFKFSQTKIVTPERVYNLDIETDEEATEFKTFLSRQEYRMITKRLQRGLRQTISDGGYIANAPYGYIKTVVNRKPTLEINEDEAYFVRMIYNLYVNEGIGSVLIANTVNALGASPHRAAKFGRTSIAQILKNPVYIGKIVWDKKKHIRKGKRGNDKHITIYQPREQWTIVDGMHPPIISEDLFAQAQQIMDSRSHPPSNDGTVKNPMAGLIRCKVCGSVMQRQGQSRGVPYILCTTKGCVAGAKAEFVERALLDNLRAELQRIELSLPTAKQEDTVQPEKGLAATRTELVKLETQKGSLYDLLEQGVYDIPTYKARMQAVVDKIKAAQKREASQAAEIARIKKQDKKALARQLHTVLDAYAAANEKHRNMLLKSVVHEVTYFKAKKTDPENFELLVRLKQY